ncbi:MAG: hydrogenase nickel incorporation protein HypB [Syntrophorhabdaceae bacterium]|nr:hydrogenase nickel incorporation protein HypB [Syntrophorhabdaceae bacterium]
MKIEVVKDILDANEEWAKENRRFFDGAKLISINIMASPGAGKTSLIMGTLESIGSCAAVIEGDIASTIDAEKIGTLGVPVVQINTGGACHLDAAMIKKALERLDLKGLKYLFIENVGNLICPAEFNLGEHVRVIVASVPEGDDKPFKYPGIFSTAQAVVLNKWDTLSYFDFDFERFKRGIYSVNPEVPVFRVSCKTKEGLGDWIDWLKGLTY